MLLKVNMSADASDTKQLIEVNDSESSGICPQTYWKLVNLIVYNMEFSP
jgi:hypothetical protein